MTSYTQDQLDACYRQLAKAEGGYFAFCETDFAADLVAAAIERHTGKTPEIEPVTHLPGYWRVVVKRPRQKIMDAVKRGARWLRRRKTAE